MLIICLIGYLVVLILISKFLSRQINGLNDFFLAGRSLSGYAIALTFVASWFGAGSTIGTMSQAFEKGLSSLWFIAIPSFISCLIVGLFLAEKIRKMESLSQPEAVEKHYGALGSFMLSWIILASITTFIASQLVAAGQLLQITAGFSPEASVVLIMSAIVIYSIIGGFRAVVMTDIFQFVCFTLALIIMLLFVMIMPVKNLYLNLPVGFWNPLDNISGNLAMACTFVMAWSIAPEMWQRMSSTKNPKDSKKAAFTAVIILFALYAMVIVTGMMAAFHIPADKVTLNGNTLLSIAMILPSPVLTAIVLIGVLSAVTSTIDSSLNVGSLTFTRDILNRHVWQNASHRQLVIMSRVITAIIGVPAAMIALYYQNLIQVLWISADIYASTMFIPILGIFFAKNSGRMAGVLAMLFGALPVVLNFLKDFHLIVLPAFWPVWPYTTILGVGLSLTGFCLGLFITGLKNRNHSKVLSIDSVKS